MENKIECFIFPETFQDLRGEIKNKDNGKWRAIGEGLEGGKGCNKEENSSKEEVVNLVGCKRGSSKQRLQNSTVINKMPTTSCPSEILTKM